jgi:quinol monooxygenase YgiN
MIIRYGNAVVRESRRADVEEHALRLQKLTLAEEGCLDYRFSWAFGEPNKLNLIERWADDVAYEFHTGQDYVKEFGAFMNEVMAGPGPRRCSVLV